MKKLKKKKTLISSRERPFLFMQYLDGNKFLEQDEGGRIVSPMEKMSNLRINLGGISNLSILHLEMMKIKGFTQNCWRVDLAYVTHNYVLLILGFMV
jgi:hypothetical protein